jgi:protein-L-isoaspartate(D-aspartate) O-methyltransferase
MRGPIKCFNLLPGTILMSDFKSARETMVDSQIRPNAVTNVALLKALLDTPREAFVPPSQRNLAYMDGALRIEAARDGQPARYLLPPMVFAKLAQLAAVKDTDKVLDIGPGTGYSTALLARLGREVIGLESDAGLAALAQDALVAQGIGNARIITGQLASGASENGPFDVIFLNGRIPVAPDKLFSQLRPEGRLVAIVGGETAARAYLFIRIDSTVQEVPDFDAGAPSLPGFEVKEEFSF